MGRALIQLLLLAALAPQASATAQDANMEELKVEFLAIRERLAAPDSFEQGRRELHLFFAGLKSNPNASPELRFHRAKELAQSAQLTPDPLERAAYFGHAASSMLELDDSKSDENAANALLDQAQVLYDLARVVEARDVLRQRLGDLDKSIPQLPSLLISLADMERKLGEFDSALSRVTWIEDHPSEHPSYAAALDKAGLIRALTWLDLGIPGQAADWLRAWADRVEQRFLRGEASADERFGARIQLLHLARNLNDYAGAAQQARALLAADDVADNPDYHAIALLELGIAELELERDGRLAGESDESEATREGRGATRGADHLRAALERGLPSIQQVFALTRLAEEALERAELDRAAVLLERMRAASNDSVPLSLRIEETTLEARLALARGAGEAERSELLQRLSGEWKGLVQAWAGAPRGDAGLPFLKYSRRRSALSMLIRLHGSLGRAEGGTEHALERVVETQELAAISRTSGPSARITLADLRERLIGDDRARGILVYLPAREGSHVFALDGLELTHHELEPSAILESTRRSYVSWLLTRNVEGMDDAQVTRLALEERKRAEALAAVLLPADLRTRIEKWERVTIVGSDLLGRVPFAWIPFGQEPHYGLRTAIDYLPTLPFGVQRSAEAIPPATRELVLLTDARPAAGLELARVQPDATTRSDLEEIYGAGLESWTGERATASTLLGEELSELTLLQFFVHAIETDTDAVPVALALTPELGRNPGAGGASEGGAEGLFRAADVARLKSAPRAVVLTACGSGQGPTRRGDAYIGTTTGAWLAAGSRVVLAALDELSVAQASRATSLFHDRIRREGDSPAEAARFLRAAEVNADPRLAPFRHGMLQVVGLGHEALFEPMETGRRPSRELMALAAVLFIALAGAAFLRKKRRRST